MSESLTGAFITAHAPLMARLRPDKTVTPGDVLLSSPSSFVDFFAKINAVKIGTYTEESREKAVKTNGHSRAEPTPVVFHCKRGKCQYQTFTYSRFRFHSQVCKGLNKTDRPFVCDIYGNDFHAKDDLRRHKQMMHSDQGYQCPHYPVKLNTHSEYKRHFREIYDLIETGPCNGVLVYLLLTYISRLRLIRTINCAFARHAIPFSNVVENRYTGSGPLIFRLEKWFCNVMEDICFNFPVHERAF
jgi:hypothetical protein